MRPIPYSWRKTVGKTKKSKYNEYLERLNEDDRATEEMLDELYTQKLREFYKIMNDYKTKYYKRLTMRPIDYLNKMMYGGEVKQGMMHGGEVHSNLKPIPEDNKGLAKLPEKVRNKMGQRRSKYGI